MFRLSAARLRAGRSNLAAADAEIDDGVAFLDTLTEGYDEATDPARNVVAP